MGRIARILKNEQGSALVLVAFGLVVMIGAAALALDAGLLYINRARLVNALDSAVLAGVQHLPADPGMAEETAVQYARLNGLTDGEYSFTVSQDHCSLSGRANRQVPLHFAGIFNRYMSQVGARAAARVSPINAAANVVPFGVLEGDFEFGELVTLKEGAGNNTYAGWFGALCLGRSGAKNYEDNIKEGYEGEISVGDILPIESGNMSGPTKRGVDYRLNQCQHFPRCTIDSFAEGCSRILIVPVVRIEEINSGGHPDSVKVVGFAAFLVSRYTGHGNENMVEGAFVRYLIPGKTGGSPGDFGLYSAYLYE